MKRSYAGASAASLAFLAGCSYDTPHITKSPAPQLQPAPRLENLVGPYDDLTIKTTLENRKGLGFQADEIFFEDAVEYRIRNVPEGMTLEYAGGLVPRELVRKVGVPMSIADSLRGRPIPEGTDIIGLVNVDYVKDSKGNGTHRIPDKEKEISIMFGRTPVTEHVMKSTDGYTRTRGIDNVIQPIGVISLNDELFYTGVATFTLPNCYSRVFMPKEKAQKDTTHPEFNREQNGTLMYETWFRGPALAPLEGKLRRLPEPPKPTPPAQQPVIFDEFKPAN